MSATHERGAVMPTKKLPFDIYTPAEKLTYLKIGIYGDSGVGKTTLAATAPKPIFINIEGGEAALLGRSDVSIVKVEDYLMVDKVYQYLKSGKHEFETVVIDSLTELQKRAMDMVLAGEGRDMPHQGSWGHSMEYVRRTVRKFRDLDMHVVFIMGLADRKDGMTGMTMEMPNLPGKLGQEIPSYLDIMGYMTMSLDTKTKTYSRSLRVQPSARWRAKDRTGTLGAVIHEDVLDMSYIIDKVRDAERKDEAVVEDHIVPVDEEA